MDAAEGAGVEPPAPSDHEWAHAGTDRVEMLQVHPLPLLVLPDRGGRRSRRARRRVRECNDAIQGLNWYAGYDYGLPQPCSAPNSLQKLAVARVEQLVRAQPPPIGDTVRAGSFLGAAAWSERLCYWRRDRIESRCFPLARSGVDAPGCSWCP